MTLAHVRGLYGMVDLAADVAPDVAPDAAAALARALLDGGARVLQLRAKHASARLLLELGARLREVTRARDAWLIVNDRVDVALEVGADGVHLGQDDLPLAAARRLVPASFAIGISTHDASQAREAARAGADYLGFGPCFATQSKRDRWPPVGLDQLAAICRELPLPIVAIGGITSASIADVARAGAAAAAVIGAIRDAADPVGAATDLSMRFWSGAQSS